MVFFWYTEYRNYPLYEYTRNSILNNSYKFCVALMMMVMTKSLLLFFFLTQWVRKRSNSEWLLNLRHLHDFNWFGTFISSKEYNKNHFFPTNLNNESDRDVTTLTVTLKEILQSYPKVFSFFFFKFSHFDFCEHTSLQQCIAPFTLKNVKLKRVQTLGVKWDVSVYIFKFTSFAFHLA